jgi:hypothetical protein
VDAEDAPIVLTPARTGRQRAPRRAFEPHDLVRVEVRMPASTAARIYQRAHDTRQPVSTMAAELINTALEQRPGVLRRTSSAFATMSPCCVVIWPSSPP